MKKALLWILVAAQVAVLAFMAGEREWVQRTGQRVWLRTAPIDPNDPMRGDYVRLSYEAGEVPWSLCRGEVAAWGKKGKNEGDYVYHDYRYARKLRDRVVYAELAIDAASGLGSVVALHAGEPAGKLFLRGRVERVDERGVGVRYGIEALFMEQGTAQKMEDSMRQENEGRALRVEVAVGRGGLTVMRRHEWEALSIRVELERGPEVAAEQVNGDDRGAANRRTIARARNVVAAKVTLKNHGTEPLVLVMRGEGRSFRMVPANRRWTNNPERWRWARDEAVAPQDAGEALISEVKMLKPGETWSERLDFSDERWRVIDTKEKDGKPRQFAELENAWDAWFRLEYVSPAPEQCVGLSLPAKLWLGRVASRSFNPTGAVD